MCSLAKWICFRFPILVQLIHALFFYKVWDTSGQLQYQTLATGYLQKADGVLIVYDLTNKDSFAHVHNWLHSVSLGAPAHAAVLVVGNKLDLTEARVVRSVLVYCLMQLVWSILGNFSSLKILSKPSEQMEENKRANNIWHHLRTFCCCCENTLTNWSKHVVCGASNF